MQRWPATGWPPPFHTNLEGHTMLYLISVALLYPADRVSPLDDLDIAVISRRP